MNVTLRIEMMDAFGADMDQQALEDVVSTAQVQASHNAGC